MPPSAPAGACETWPAQSRTRASGSAPRNELFIEKRCPIPSARRRDAARPGTASTRSSPRADRRARGARRDRAPRRPASRCGARHGRDRPASIASDGHTEGRPQLVRPFVDELPESLGQLRRSLDRMGDRAVRDEPLEGMEAKLERGHDPEVRAGSSHAPEELGMLVRARPHDPAVRGHDLDGEQAVDRQTELALQPAHPAAEREAGHSRVGDDADRAGRARAPAPPRRARRAASRRERGRCDVRDRPRRRASARGRSRCRRRRSRSRGCCGRRTERRRRAPLTGEAEGGDDVVGARRPHDQRRPTVDHAVPDPRARCRTPGRRGARSGPRIPWSASPGRSVPQPLGSSTRTADRELLGLGRREAELVRFPRRLSVLREVQELAEERPRLRRVDPVVRVVGITLAVAAARDREDEQRATVELRRAEVKQSPEPVPIPWRCWL